MTNFDSSDLRDPQPPIPGERERALVAARADRLGRRRRMVQCGGALALVAAVAVSVAALTGGGGSSGPSRVETASGGRESSTLAPVTQASAPATVATTAPAPAPAPAVAPETTPAPSALSDATPVPAVQAAPAPAVVPSTFTLSGTVVGNPAATTVTLTITGPAGSLVATADGAGHFSLGGLTAGDYTVVGQWTDSTGTATGASRMGTVSVNGDTSVNLSF